MSGANGGPAHAARANDRTMQHWTPNTSHCRTSPRSEVTDLVVNHMRQRVVTPLDCGEEPPAGAAFPTFRVRKNAGAPADLFSATLFHETAGAVLGMYINAGGGPNPEGWEYAWRNHRGENGPRPDPAPEGPWCVDDLEETGLLKLGPEEQVRTAVWSADFARCLAWAVIKSRAAA